ncbi:unnamed protein product [Protopolystoma xenopodis]|uniref:Uncharacterized protein n=1 Tax=Protopolystoma xenopodis TaxID=117903 RepID=A0A448WKX5_9PLAT|nr:unnamed protein product [Protopolystoma xenopodis]
MSLLPPRQDMVDHMIGAHVGRPDLWATSGLNRSIPTALLHLSPKKISSTLACVTHACFRTLKVEPSLHQSLRLIFHRLFTSLTAGVPQSAVPSPATHDRESDGLRSHLQGPQEEQLLKVQNQVLDSGSSGPPEWRSRDPKAPRLRANSGSQRTPGMLGRQYLFYANDSWVYSYF